MINRLSHQNSEGAQILKSRNNYWMDLTLSTIEKNLKNDDPIIMSSIYNEKLKTIDWQENYGIIQGASGVGLVLLSAINSTFKNWDSFLLTSIH